MVEYPVSIQKYSAGVDKRREIVKITGSVEVRKSADLLENPRGF